jgi:hypothetical protein
VDHARHGGGAWSCAGRAGLRGGLRTCGCGRRRLSLRGSLRRRLRRRARRGDALCQRPA